MDAKIATRKSGLAVSEYKLLAFFAFFCCLAIFISALIQQFQMILLGGRVVIGNSLLKAGLLAVILFGCLLRPKLSAGGLPITSWLFCLLYLAGISAYLIFGCGMSASDVMVSYYDYYFIFLVGPALIVFRGALSEKLLLRISLIMFFICALLALAQHLTNSPILPTESADGSYTVESWNFFGQVRAFSLFGSALEFGLYCAFAGALGVAFSKSMPVRGTLLTILSGVMCYLTLTRLSYLIFFGACLTAFVLTYGKKPWRAQIHPFIYAILGLLTIAWALRSFIGGSIESQDVASTVDRVTQWVFYYDMLQHVTWIQLLFGSGIVQIDTILPKYPMLIDNVPLALVLHIGFVGLLLFIILTVKMWLYLRREAIDTKQPFFIAIASIWAMFICGGIFNILFAVYGSIFGLAVLCERKQRNDQDRMDRRSSEDVSGKAFAN